VATQDRPFPLTKPTASEAVGFDRARIIAFEDVQQTDINERTQPATDPTNSDWLHRQHITKGFRLLFGRVVDSIAYVNAYKVQGERGAPSIWCMALSQTALLPIGAHQFGQLSVGCSVIYIDDESFNEVIAPTAPNTFARYLSGSMALSPYMK